MTMIVPALLGGLKAAGAAAGAASGGSGLFSASSLLSGVATAGGVLAAIGAGRAQSESYKAQAFTSKMEADNEQVAGLQRQTAMKRELARILGENDVNYAASGIDLSGGVAKEARDTAEAQAAREINIDRSMTDAKRGMLRAGAATYRRMAKQAKTTGFFNAVTAGATGLSDMRRA
jgi:hypothetical protein